MIAGNNRRTINVLHHQIVRTYVVDLAYIGVVQRRDRIGFALEALAELRGGNFDGDIAVQPRIARAPDFAHATLAERREDFVRPEFIAGRQGHTWGSVHSSRVAVDRSWMTAYPEVGRPGRGGATMILPGETEAALRGRNHAEG